MASRRFNFIFKDGCEYEVTAYEGGAIKIRNGIGVVVFENGQLQTLDILAILETFKEELKAADGGYDNPIVKKEAERMTSKRCASALIRKPEVCSWN